MPISQAEMSVTQAGNKNQIKTVFCVLFFQIVGFRNNPCVVTSTFLMVRNAIQWIVIVQNRKLKTNHIQLKIRIILWTMLTAAAAHTYIFIHNLDCSYLHIVYSIIDTLGHEVKHISPFSCRQTHLKTLLEATEHSTSQDDINKFFLLWQPTVCDFGTTKDTHGCDCSDSKMFHDGGEGVVSEECVPQKSRPGFPPALSSGASGRHVGIHKDSCLIVELAAAQRWCCWNLARRDRSSGIPNPAGELACHLVNHKLIFILARRTLSAWKIQTVFNT